MLVPQIIAGLLIGAGIGFFIGHFWTRRRTVETWVRDRERLESKVRSCDRDLDKTRGELKSLRDYSTNLKQELTAATSRLQTRDQEVAAFEGRIKSFDAVMSELTTKRSELESLTPEVESLRSKLAKAEAELRTPVKPDPSLSLEIDELKQIGRAHV